MKKLFIVLLALCGSVQLFAQADPGIQNVLMSPVQLQVGQTGQLTTTVRNNGAIPITAGCVFVQISVPSTIGVATLTLNSAASDPMWTASFGGGSGQGFINVRNTAGILPNDFQSHPIVLNVSADAPGGPLTIQSTISYVTSATQPGCAALGNSNLSNDNATTSVIVTGISTWTGDTDTNWDDPTNWLPNLVPGALDKAIIPDVTGASGNFPVLASPVSIFDLQIDAGATVDLGGLTFTINGPVTGTGTISAVPSPASNLIITGTAGTLRFTAASHSLRNFTLNAGASATLGSALDIIPNTAAAPGTVTVNAGAVLTTGGNLTIKSNSTATARVGTSAGTINGDATVERFINNPQRAWHLLSTNTTGSQTIKQAWQENGVVATQKGTWMTSGASLLPGFDATSVSGSSILIFDQAVASWTTIPVSSTLTPLSARPGYFLFVRGDRTCTATNALVTPTLLRSAGALNQGTLAPVVVSSTSTGRTLVGNPYASAINMETIFTGTPNLDQNMMVWDPAIAGTSGVGGYRAIVRTAGGTYQHTPVALGTPTTTNTNGRFIHSGQAFFLKATGADASVVFTEAIKSATTPTVIYNPIVEAAGDQTLIANLMAVPAGGTEATLRDGIRVAFNNTYLASTKDDIEKMGNYGENLSSYRDGVKLIVEKRPMIVSRDVIYLRMTNTAVKDYRFQIGTIDFTQADVKGYLEDTYLNKLTPLDLSSAINNIDFSITSNSASANPDRFKIVFSSASPLPQTSVAIKAAQQGSNIAVEWKATNQYEIKQYELEKSADGINFTKVETKASVGLNGSDANYTWLDEHALTGNNYYRVRTVRISGETKYSDMVNVTMGKLQPGISIYPNPVTNRTVALQMTDMEKGIYQLKLMSTAGQVVMTSQVNHGGGDAMQPVGLPKQIANGSYRLEITRPDKSRVIKDLVIANQ